jgi:hypothetical protein
MVVIIINNYPMKLFILIFLLAFVSNAYAFTIVKPGSLRCTNSTTQKTVIIKPKSPITVWYKNDQNEVVKTTGYFKRAQDGMIEIKRVGIKDYLQIPFDKIAGVSKRHNSTLLWSSIGFGVSSFLMGAITKLLINVDRSNNSTT